MKEHTAPFLPSGGIRAVFIGVAATVICMLLLSFLLSAIIYFSPLSESLLPRLAILSNTLSLLFGGWMAGRLAGSRGLLVGMLTSAIILILMLLFGFGEGVAIPLKLVYCLLAGMIGGIFGVR